MPSSATATSSHSTAFNFSRFRSVIEQRPELAKLATPRVNQYIPHKPTPHQAAFLLLPHLEALYGGAAGGGKTDALLMSALQYADVPGYSALLLRRTFRQLNHPQSVLFRAHSWLRRTGANWVAQHNRYEFPSGALLTFGYCQHDGDVYQYDSAEFQFIGFDELTQFTEFQYRFMFGRLRRLLASTIPIRMRTASNPGGIGHAWVKQHFLLAKDKQRVFLPAKLEDNPHIDQAEYDAVLSRLDAVTRAQRRRGDWDATAEGAMFKRIWFQRLQDTPPKKAPRVRYWDLAATENGGDYTVGTRVSEEKGTFYVEDVQRARYGPGNVEKLVEQTATVDGRDVAIRIEQEPGASGKSVIASFVRKLAGFDIKGVVKTGSKETNWRPFAAQCEANNVVIINGPWNSDWIDEMTVVPNAQHDDQADSVAGAFNCLAGETRPFLGFEFLGGRRASM